MLYMTVARDFRRPNWTSLVSKLPPVFINIKDYPSLTETNIDTFMSLYRDSFPHATVTPKLHMLEDHVVPFLRRWKVGFGFLGEQGAESIHARFNSLRQNFVNMPNPVQRLLAILNEHLSQVCPENIVRQPAPKKRKKNTEA